MFIKQLIHLVQCGNTTVISTKCFKTVGAVEALGTVGNSRFSSLANFEMQAELFANSVSVADSVGKFRCKVSVSMKLHRNSLFHMHL